MSKITYFLLWGIVVGAIVTGYGWFITQSLVENLGLAAGTFLQLLDPISLLYMKFISPLFPHGTLFGLRFTFTFYGLHFVIGFFVGLLFGSLFWQVRSALKKIQT